MRFGVGGWGLGVGGLGLGVWGLGFGVWGLGFKARVSGLELSFLVPLGCRVESLGHLR